MIDPRVNQLAVTLVNYSCRLKAGEKVLIECTGLELQLVQALINNIYKVGGIPFVTIKDKAVDRAILRQANLDQVKMAAGYEMTRMRDMDAYIGIRSGSNASELSDVPSDKMEMYQKYFFEEVHSRIRVPDTKWVILRFPTPSMAQAAGMSTESFEDHFFEVCNLDYKRMSDAMDPLVDLLDHTRSVRLVGPGTDLRFSIEGIKAVKCDGKRNIPDGEVYTAPVRDSVNGIITYNTPAVYQSINFENIKFEFKEGRIIKATSNNDQRLNQILDTDEGARYIGEFSFGLNPGITFPIKDTLFDEKITVSINLNPGNCYKECSNGNHSAIHWDLVLIQTPEHGGGEIYLDEVLVRKDGRFVLPELKGLNPENLI
ncbi:MAG TPA: aminopeptidase [Syntrophomonadaceae bacterium]|nr:aminopeptidase [Syntrophomonadaceae bacterium]